MRGSCEFWCTKFICSSSFVLHSMASLPQAEGRQIRPFGFGTLWQDSPCSASTQGLRCVIWRGPRGPMSSWAHMATHRTRSSYGDTPRWPKWPDSQGIQHESSTWWEIHLQHESKFHLCTYFNFSFFHVSIYTCISFVASLAWTKIPFMHIF